jgi:hypothetical protein
MPETAAPGPGPVRMLPPPSRNGSGPPRPIPTAPAAPPAPDVAHPDRQPPAGLFTSAGRSTITQLRRILRRTFRRA